MIIGAILCLIPVAGYFLAPRIAEVGFFGLLAPAFRMPGLFLFFHLIVGVPTLVLAFFIRARFRWAVLAWGSLVVLAVIFARSIGDPMWIVFSVVLVIFMIAAACDWAGLR